MDTVRFANHEELTGHGRTTLRTDALAIAAAGLRAADPADELARALRIEGDRLLVRGTPISGLDRRGEEGATVIDLTDRRLFLLGAGKATLGMAEVLDGLLGPRFADAAVVVKRGQAPRRALRYMEVLEAAHPVPDETSLAGGRRLQAVATAARPGDLVIALVTGGSSALAVVPAEDISLADKIETNRLLLASGADIVDINDVRKHLSAIKGGRLGAACGCDILNFTASDVVGDPLDYVTDLTVPDSSTWAEAQSVCDRFGLWDVLPAAVAARLRRADQREETLKELPAVRTWIMADAARMCAAAIAEAQARGYAAELLGLDWQGEARDAGASLARRLAGRAPRSCLVVGGENTVTLAGGAAPGRGGPRREAASAALAPGRGGPNQEAALAAALELAGGPAAAVVCLDSDGSDGPTDAAGGLVDDATAAALAAAGSDGVAALAGHDACDALARAGDLVFTGPTDTNVNDLKIALRGA
jgi:glycerate 2-kinase